MKSLSGVSQSAIKILENCGYQAYVVGGFVRNMLMGIPAHDVDICTNALPHEIISAFESFNVIETGIKHGTVTVIIESIPVEITTFRIDGEYLRHRKPEKVLFTSSLYEDLSRRDFTINAMAFCEKSGVCDPFGGKKDLENKIIRCVGNPTERFEEDALRILRALRFSAVLGFDIEKETKSAIFSLYTLLSHISAERITSEFLKLLEGEYAEKVLKEFAPLFKFLTESDTAEIATKLAHYENNINLRLSLFPHTHFLRLPSKQKKQVDFLRKNRGVDITCKYDVLKLLSENGAENVQLLFFATKNEKALDILNGIIDRGDCFSTKMLAVSGSDLIKLGYSGSEIGEKLAEILELVMKNELQNIKSDLLSYAKKNIF